MNEPRYIVCVRDYFNGRPPLTFRAEGVHRVGRLTYPAALEMARELRENPPVDSIGSDYWLEPC